MKEYGLGCVKPLYDPRDFQFSDIIAGLGFKKKEEKVIETLPDNYYPPRTLLFDQGISQMCCACAVSLARYIQEFNQINKRIIFSPYYIYGNRVPSTTLKDGEIYTGEGMYLKDALKKATSGVAPLSSCYPVKDQFGYLKEMSIMDYIGPYSEVSYRSAKSCYEIANISHENFEDSICKPYCISSYYALNSEEEIAEAILGTGCVVATFLVTSGWYETKENGIINNTGMIQGAHAVVIAGWKTIGESRYWIILNSWGTEWGDHGYGYINVNEQRWILEAYCMIDDVSILDKGEEKDE